MKDFITIAFKYFDKYPIKIDEKQLEETIKRYNLTLTNYEAIVKDLRANISFFEKEVSSGGITLSNLVSYAATALYIPRKDWNGSKNRNRITTEYKEILEGTKSIKSFDISNEELSNGAILELESLPGLTNIKEEIRALMALAKVRKRKIEFGLPPTPSTLHMVFVGNPGTGKTTVARLIGKIYKTIGLLKNGHVIEVSRKDLVGQYVGHTAPLVNKKFGEAEGGILFIDEAYSLTNNKTSNDFGNEAIQELLRLMENKRDTTVVIVAGYPKEMQTFINSNPGLKSRFSTHIYFEDYKVDELVEIIKYMVKSIDHIFTDAASAKMEYLLEEKYSSSAVEDNARYARNIFDQVLKNQSMRLSISKNLTRYDMQLLTDKDVPDII